MAEKIALWYSENNFKYETEATCKLFINIPKFDFFFDEKPKNKNFILIRCHRGKEKYYFTILLNIENIRERSGKIVDIDKIKGDDDKEQILTCLLYSLLQKITKKNPPWGMVTGIRPVKKVNILLDSGCSKEEIYKCFKEKYKISDKKINLAYNTAITQRDILKLAKGNSASLYISIPFCPTRCSYCSFVSQSIENAKNLIPEYVEKLCEELKIYSEIINNLGYYINSIYIGGGTPTTLTARQFKILLEVVNRYYDLSKVLEFSVEAGRPDTITEDKLNVLKKYGVNRISVNPETFNDDVLKKIGREHTSGDTLKAIELVKKYNFECINMDLIAGLPSDTEESFINSVDKCIELEAENITIHTLTLKRSADLFNEWNKNIEAPVTKMVDYSQSKLEEYGYYPYYLYRQKNTLENLENVGFTKENHASIYNILIMEETQTIFAAGSGASTKLVKNGKIKRIHNYKFPYEYIKDFDKLMEKKKEIYNILKV